MDRGYNDYKWWDELDSNGIFFVTRLKSNAVYEGIRRKPGRRSKNVNDDESVMLKKGLKNNFALSIIPIQRLWHEYHFITNANKLSAQTIANIYKERWQIELFFKWVKQNLKFKTFLGTSANAVMTHLGCALFISNIISH